MDGLRTRALSGENVSSGTYAANWVDGGAGEPDAAGVSETGRVPQVGIAISGPRSVGFSGVTVRPGDLSVLSI